MNCSREGGHNELDKTPWADCQGETNRAATGFDRIAAAGDRVAEMVSRLDKLSERLTGAQPESKADSIAPSPPGLLGSLFDYANSVDRAMQRAADALVRIEQQLP